MNWFKLFIAIASVESGLEASAVNEIEGAYGLVQIRRGVIDDVNDYYKLDIRHHEVFDISTAYRVFLRYLTMWAGKLEMEITVENLAQLWHYGPSRCRIALVGDYTNRVKNIYESL